MHDIRRLRIQQKKAPQRAGSKKCLSEPFLILLVWRDHTILFCLGKKNPAVVQLNLANLNNMAKRVQVAKAAQADKRARGERSGGATGGLTPQHPLPPAATSGAAAAAAKEPEKWMAQRARAHTRVGLRYQVVRPPCHGIPLGNPQGS